MIKITLSFDHPKVIFVLPNKIADKTVVLIDCEAYRVENDAVQITLNVIFNSIPIVNSRTNRHEGYIASRGAYVLLRTLNGDIRKCSEGENTEVTNKTADTMGGSLAVKLEPQAIAESSERTVSGTLGTFGVERELGRADATTFVTTERVLDTSESRKHVRWSIMLPRGSRAIRDFFENNFDLFAVCSYPDPYPTGEISLNPNVQFFNSERRPIQRSKELLILFELWCKRIEFFPGEIKSMKFRAVK